MHRSVYFIVLSTTLHFAQLTVSVAQTSKRYTFTNPLLPSGADPWAIYKNGYYYYTHTLGNKLAIWKTRNMADLKTAEKKIIFTPPPGTAYSKELWAPELHFLDGKWYMYFAADDGKNDNHRLYVLENDSKDPMSGEWKLKARLKDDDDKWAIDGSVFRNAGQLYIVWSGWEGDTNGQQDLYIAKMKNPWTIDGKRVRISSPQFEWEKHGDLNDPVNPPHVNVNEGPQILKNGKQLYLIFSASGCWTDHYSLGMLLIDSSANLMDSSLWFKFQTPAFVGNEKNRVFAPGHNSFFKSPDGREDWILYHANPAPNCGCGRQRSPRMQRFSWNEDGTPNFGIPIAPGVALKIPAEQAKPVLKKVTSDK
ncbi:MAG: glycoside hydrolase family 43 protein [Chitinophagaceae bacterium]|nr:glycoside hydrolase family 43 protein [Chitinophagaceae bacterium]